MKFSKIFTFLAAIAMTAFIFSACTEESDNPVNGDDETPDAPSNIQAAVVDSETIKLKWDASADAENSNFENYTLRISPGQFQPVDIAGSETTYTVDGLTEGNVYTFSLVSLGTNGEESQATEVTWSPATRFERNALDEPIRLYGINSSMGSGLALYVNDDGGPRTYTVNSSNKWNLAFRKNSESEILFGTAGQGAIEYNWGNGEPNDPAEIANIFYPSNDLDEVYDSFALNDDADYDYGYINLSSSDYANANGAVIPVRYKAANNPDYNYAKILIKKIDNSYLQIDDDTGDEYIELEISYQSETDVPYAGIKK